MIVYTLVGSLLMLVGGDRDRRSSPPTAARSPSRSPTSRRHPLGDGQPAAGSSGSSPPPSWSRCRPSSLHGWMPDAYRAAPLPALAVFSGVLSKVGAYGFLRIVLPLFPARRSRLPGGDPADHRAGLDPLRLGDGLHADQRAADRSATRRSRSSASSRSGSSPCAADGRRRRGAADGQPRARGRAAVLSSSRCWPSATGTEDIREMGGMAMRAPVLAALFLIVTLATLAMPGSANFVGEFYILNGALPGEDRLRLRRDHRRRDGRVLRAAALPAHDAQPQARRDRVARDRPARRARAGAAGRSASSPSRSTRS